MVLCCALPVPADNAAGAERTQIPGSRITGEGVVKLPCGVLYKEIEKGTGVVSPELTDVVSVHYRGTLANGREFDNSWKRGCPEAFRLN